MLVQPAHGERGQITRKPPWILARHCKGPMLSLRHAWCAACNLSIGFAESIIDEVLQCVERLGLVDASDSEFKVAPQRCGKQHDAHDALAIDRFASARQYHLAFECLC